MRDIFVSYRRSDSSDVTGRIFDRLKARFGEDRLFKDVDSIPLGTDFRENISEAVGQCKVLLAIIGNDWLTAQGRDGTRRIDAPDDYVHIEISTALQRRIPVVPVLVEETTIPRPEDLPPPLQGLAFRNAIAVRPDPDFHNDVDRLCGQLAKHLGDRNSDRFRRNLRWAAPAAAVILVLATLVTAALWDRFRSNDGGQALDQTPSVSQSDETSSVSATSHARAPVPIRYWIDELPNVRDQDAAKLFSNALGSWQAVVTTPIRKADSREEANVIISTSPQTQVDAQVGPPTSTDSPLAIRFGSGVEWTPRSFEAASCRMLGHILGLRYTDTPAQLMSHYRLVDNDLERLPLTPQSEDIARVREIWGN